MKVSNHLFIQNFLFLDTRLGLVALSSLMFIFEAVVKLMLLFVTCQ